jgi:hypothetical protein
VEQPNFQNSESMPLERLVSDPLGELERLGYSRRSRNRYRAVWQHLIEYCDRNKLGDKSSGDLAGRGGTSRRRGYGNFVTMSVTAEIAFSFDQGPFMSVRQS